MSKLHNLLSISSEALSSLTGDDARLPGYPVDIQALLATRNGFSAFESALVVFPTTESVGVPGIRAWNSPTGWRSFYGDVLSPEDSCFAHDLFGVQFVMTKKGVARMNPETGEFRSYADTLEGWAERLLEHFEEDTAWTLAHEWQLIHGVLPPQMRLLPKLPFVLGGEFEAHNLIAVECHQAMTQWGRFYTSIRNVPDGSPLRFDGWFS